LLDYPGCGLCQGSPNPARIRESAERAFQALQAQTHGRFAPGSLGVVGCWLGAAAALQIAERSPVGRMILVAPFTALDGMAAQSLWAFLSAHCCGTASATSEPSGACWFESPCPK
jgi:dienelactone hydrolase